MAKINKSAPAATGAAATAPAAPSHVNGKDQGATASAGSAGADKTVTTAAPAFEPVTAENIEKRLSTLLQSEDPREPDAAVEEQPQGEGEPTAGSEPSPELETPAPEAKPQEEEGEEQQPAEQPVEGEQPAADEELENVATPEWARKRIDKLTAQKYELKQQLEALQARVGELETGPEAQPARPVARGQNPLSAIRSETELSAKESEAEGMLDWVEDQLVALRRSPEAVERQLRGAQVKLTDGEGNEDYSRESMEEWLAQTRRNVEKAIRVFIPQRRQHLQAEQRYETMASSEFPFLTDRKSPEFQIAQQVIQAFPGVKDRPDWKVFVGVHTLGLMAIQAKVKAKAQNGNGNGNINGKPRVASVVAPRVATATAIPQSADPKRARLDAARVKMSKGDPTDYIKEHLGALPLVGN